MRCLRLLAILVVAMTGASTLAAQQRLNMRLLKQDSQIFEAILQRVLKQNFTHPFAIESPPMASYLQGYGLVVTFHLNINRGKIRLAAYGDGPIAKEAENSPAANKSRDEQLKLLKKELIACLADYGGSIKQLAGHERVSINAHVEDRSLRDVIRKRTILVVTASKDDIDLLALRKMSRQEFRDKVHVVRY